MTQQRQQRSDDALLQQKLEQCEALYDSLLAEKAHTSRLLSDLERHKQRADAAEREAAVLREQLAAARRCSDLSSSSCGSSSVDVLLLQRKLDRRGVELLMMQQEVQELQARLQQQRCRAEDGEAAAAAYREEYLRLWQQLATTLSFAGLGKDPTDTRDWASLNSSSGRRCSASAAAAAAAASKGSAEPVGGRQSGGWSQGPSEAVGPTLGKQLPPPTADANPGEGSDAHADADAAGAAAEEEQQQQQQPREAAWSDRSSVGTGLDSGCVGAGLRHVSTMTCTSFDSTEGGGPDFDALVFSQSHLHTDAATDHPTAAAVAAAVAVAEEPQRTHAAAKRAASKGASLHLPAVAQATEAAPAPGCLVAQHEAAQAQHNRPRQKDLKRVNLSMSPELIFVWRSVDCDE